MDDDDDDDDDALPVVDIHTSPQRTVSHVFPGHLGCPAAHPKTRQFQGGPAGAEAPGV